MNTLPPLLVPLPAGVTGFFGPGGPWIQPASPREFRTLCHSLAREAGGKVLETDETLLCKNFYAGTLLLPTGPCCLLRNAYFPYITFSASADLSAGAFADTPTFPASPLLSPYRLLQPGDLSISCTEAGVLSRLCPAELAQIRDWKPQTIGQILFNQWD